MGRKARARERASTAAVQPLPEAGDESARVRFETSTGRDGLGPPAAPAADGIMSRHIHRYKIRTRMLVAPCRGAGKIAARVGLAAGQVRANREDKNMPLETAGKGRAADLRPGHGTKMKDARHLRHERLGNRVQCVIRNRGAAICSRRLRMGRPYKEKRRDDCGNGKRDHTHGQG